MRPKLSYANVVSTLCLFSLLAGGAAYGASHLAKNSVGPKQLKKNAVVTAKVKNEAITGAKVKKGSLTGTQINASTLGTVPSAQTAQSANSIAAPEPYHEVTEFLGTWSNLELSAGGFPETVGYYKDQEGVVHLRGEAISSGSGGIVFRLPPGYRPASGKFIREPVACEGTSCPNDAGAITITGSNLKKAVEEGGVIAPTGIEGLYLDGVTFRAAS